MKIILGSRRPHYFARAGIFLIAIILIAGMVGCIGTPAVQIRDWYDFDAVRDELGGSYIMMNDLDSTTAGYEELAGPTANEGLGWQPIGGWGTRFEGSLDGRGYEIRDLFIARPDDGWVGLFSLIDGTVKNVGVVNAHVLGGDRIGALVGQNGGSVVSCYSTGSVAGGGGVGGLVGMNYRSGNEGDPYSEVATISDSYSAASVSGEWAIGGLVGRGGDILSRSFSTGSVTGNKYVGGLVGVGGGSMRDCYCVGSVTGNVSVGGLVGSTSDGVSNSYYNYDEVLINGENIITVGALCAEDFDQWLTNGRFLTVNERLSQEGGYYLIDNVSDFKQLLAFGQDSSLKFRLENDIDLAAEPDFYVPYLAGEFDGNGHRILNLSFNADFISGVGLFGYVASGGKISQVGVENVNVAAGPCTGGLVGRNRGTVNNCYSTGAVTGNIRVGGLVGGDDGDVSDSYSACSVTGDLYYAGGLVGSSERTVSNSYSTGNVSGYRSVGGLVGGFWHPGTVSNSYSTGSVTGNEYVGGLVGENDGGIYYSYAKGSVTGNRSVGGLVGGFWHPCTVSNCYSTGSVTGNKSVGGLVAAMNDGDVSNSFWDTETSGQDTSAGGTGKTTAEMQDITTFSGAGWDIVLAPDPTHIWNIYDGVDYPFLSWQS